MADTPGQDWLSRRGLTGVKIALLGGLLPLGVCLLSSRLDTQPGMNSHLARGFDLLCPFSILAMLASEILAIGYGIEAWRSVAGKFAIGTACAVMGGACLSFYISVMKTGLW